MKEQELYLLDGNSLMYRAFYALPTTLTKSDGTVTNAVFGFTRMLFSLLEEREPDLLGVAFDLAAPTFRHQEYEDYKGNRKETPDELKPQFGIVKEVLEVLEVPIFEKEGYEADDLIGTLAQRAEEEGYQVTIVTGDRDNLQLITDNITVMYNKRGISDIIDYDLEKFREEYELEPLQLIDKKGLMGDNSDNIPGVDGIGKKTSTKLLKEFGSLENVLANIDRVGGKKRKATLREQADRAKLSKKLAEIKVDVPLEVDFSELVLSDYKNQQVYDLFMELEFSSLISQIGGHQKLEVTDYQLIESQEGLEELELTEQVAITLDLSGPKLEQELAGVAVVTSEQGYYCNLTIDKLVDWLEDIFTNKKVLMVGAKEQIRYLLQQGIEVKELSFEPLVADYLLKPSEKEKGFAELVVSHLQREIEDGAEEELLVLQTSLLFDLEEELLPKLEDNELLSLFTEIELPLVSMLAQLELTGIKVSSSELERLSTKLAEKIADLEERAYQLAGEEFNLNSPKQLGVILFEKLGLPVIKRTKTGYSTSASVLEKLKGQHDIIPLISEYRTYTKLKSTYVDPLSDYINQQTGRIHTTFNQLVTATGRLSSAEPNLQNIPIRTEEGREIRQVFVAEEGKKLLAADYSQVELRVLAHISQDEGLKEAYQQGLDIHTKTASEIFELALDEVGQEERRKAKAVNFGIAYGISDWGLAKRLNITNQEAKEYIELYFVRYPKVKEYIDNTIAQAKEEGYVTTLFDRKRYLPQINSNNYHQRSFAERMAINTPIQGTAADIMKLAMIEVNKALKEKSFDAKVLLQVHDELVVEVTESEIEAVNRLVTDKMVSVVELAVDLEVDSKVGDNWKDMSELTIDN
ncbi:DNA polymerase I [Natroniella acetigena]|uniref:DNA polymerase I n=1 Tax=Natroniella acetigena TaxID=52004 RepID=UPI00200A592F|nr:DNA polymerase I [Natroniella acetigena]MCK8828505.1 DNA polymerase I [Natroniella acetigena]